MPVSISSFEKEGNALIERKDMLHVVCVDRVVDRLGELLGLPFAPVHGDKFEVEPSYW